MKISSIDTQFWLSKNQVPSDYNKESGNMRKICPSSAGSKAPSFKSAGMAALGVSSAIMQWIESKGYLISFLIQDGIGMTVPRALTGFQRDKNITGEYNFQEGLEVLGRECMTGPYMMFVAPAVLAITCKFCKSTNTNTRLIKRLGENFKTMISQPEFDQSIKNDAKKFKNEFYRYNISKIYKDTVPNDPEADKTINYLLKKFEEYDSNNGELRKKAEAGIIEKVNDSIFENSENFLCANKLYVGEGKTRVAYSASEVLRAIKDFGDDAITNNPSHSSIDSSSIVNIKNNFATKRFLTNITNIVVTMGGLSVLPKIYAKSDVAPGANTITHIQKKKEAMAESSRRKTPDEDSTISFKGKGINSDGLFARAGKFLTKYTPEKFNELLEYTGYNFSKTTFALLATLGLLLPRGKRAWDRAQIDENGKRDMTEINEILLRDSISSLSVVFAVPFLTKMIVKSYEDNVGFILTNRASDGKNMLRKALDIIIPYSKLEVLSVADLEAIYGNIDSKTKLMNFSRFVDSKGGDLEKILSKSENSNIMFNEKTFKLESIKNLSRKEKNKKIIELFDKISETDAASKEGIIKLMKGSGSVKNNKIAEMARGLNSVPGFISTVFISPIILGVLIPLLTYHNTRKANAKKIDEIRQG